MNRIVELSGMRCEGQLRSEASPTLVHFYTSWSGQCQILAVSLDALAGDLEGQLRIAKVNLDNCPDVAGYFGIAQVPTLILFDNGTPVARFTGLASPRELKASLQGLLADYTTPPGN